MEIRNYPVAIIGGGPVGMAAAAHLTERKIPFILFESGNSVGASLLDWQHIAVFTPWKYNIDKAAERLLQEVDWRKPDEEGLPTGKEILDNYLIPLAFHPKIKPFIHANAKVLSISRKGIRKIKTAGRERQPFVIRVYESKEIKAYQASVVIDASGTWFNPSPIGADGVPAIGERENGDRITYRIPDILEKDREIYANKTVVVVGAGHSAINSLLDLASLQEKYPLTKLHWVLHKENMDEIYGGKEEDALKARGALGIRIENLVQSGVLEIHNPYSIEEIGRKKGRLNIKGVVGGISHTIAQVDEIIANTGARPDVLLSRELRVQYDPALESVPALASLIDPNIHSCGTVRPHGEAELRQPEPDFYVVGAKSYGRAPTFLMATGYEQVRSIAAYLDGDIEGANRVELDLPETGVCSADGKSSSACCTPAVSNTKEKEEEKSEAECCAPAVTKPINTSNMKKEEVIIEEPVAASSCCGGAPTSNEEACCKLDEDKKAEGETGCGCNDPSPVQEKASACC